MNKLTILAALLALAFVASDATPRHSQKAVQVIYREDEDQGVWNIYIVGAVCEEGKLTLVEPAEPRFDPIRVQCVMPRK